jgi:hypothetical protein
MKTGYLFAAIILSSLTFSSCEDIFCTRGNGMSETVTHRSMGFNSIENKTGIDVVYKKADTTSIVITADENLINEISTETNNNTLSIRTRGNKCLDFNTRPLITITSPTLQKVYCSGSGSFIADEISGSDVNIKLTGSGEISAATINANNLTISLSGSGNISSPHCISSISDLFLSGSGKISLTGQGETSIINVSGSGDIRCENYTSATSDIRITGSGDVFTLTESSLTAFISGSGNIYLKGTPAIDKTITGSGRIIKY